MELIKRNKIVVENMNLVERLARAKKRRVISPQVSYEDLVSAGYSALVEVTEKYDERVGPFDVYASKRISGAMTDCVYQILRWGRRNTTLKTERSGRSVPNGISMSSLGELNYCDSSLVYCDEDRDTFDDMVRTLPELGQTVLRWRYVDGLTYKQIGERLGVVESRVAQKVREYKDRLRAAYWS